MWSGRREVGERAEGREVGGEYFSISADVCTHCFLRSKTSSANIMSTLRGTLSSSCNGKKGRMEGRMGGEDGGWMGGEDGGEEEGG